MDQLCARAGELDGLERPRHVSVKHTDADVYDDAKDDQDLKSAQAWFAHGAPPSGFRWGRLVRWATERLRREPRRPADPNVEAASLLPIARDFDMTLEPLARWCEGEV